MPLNIHATQTRTINISYFEPKPPTMALNYYQLMMHIYSGSTYFNFHENNIGSEVLSLRLLLKHFHQSL